MNRSSLFVALALVPLMSAAQTARVKLPDFSGLADKARESVDIALDREMLRTAGAFSRLTGLAWLALLTLLPIAGRHLPIALLAS